MYIFFKHNANFIKREIIKCSANILIDLINRRQSNQLYFLQTTVFHGKDQLIYFYINVLANTAVFLTI